MRTKLVASTAFLIALALCFSPGTGAAWSVPDTIVLRTEATADTGFRAEGIVSRGHTAWAGSLASGGVVRADLVTGELTTLVESADAPAVGLDIDGHGRLWVAGGDSGTARVYDAWSGELMASFELGEPGASFINDVSTVGDAAYFTDSQSDLVHRVPIAADGSIGSPQALTITGDFELAEGFNNNGIVAVDSEPLTRLIVAQSTDPDGEGSALYVLDPSPEDGIATSARIVLTGPTADADVTADETTGGDITNADGLVLRGRTLYVVENRQDRIAQIRLAADLREGVVVDRLTNDNLATPTTATLALGGLYVVNARFSDLGGGADPSSLDFEIVRVEIASRCEPSGR